MLATWDAVSTLFDDMMGSTLGAATNSRTFTPDIDHRWQSPPAIDVRATDEELLLVCDVPGVKQEDLDVTLHEHVLTIKGARKFDSAPGQQVVIGRSYGAFTRSFTLPSSLDEEKLSADLSEGVLTIRIPKSLKAKPFKVQIGTKQLEKK